MAARSLLFMVLSVPIVLHDIKYRTIPDALTLLGIAALLTGCAAGGFDSFLRTVIGMAAGFLLFLFVRIITRGRLGLGDAKYAAFLGGLLGVRWWLVSVFLAALGGLVFCLIMIVLKRMTREERIPFAPFLAGGSAIVLLISNLGFTAFI